MFMHCFGMNIQHEIYSPSYAIKSPKKSISMSNSSASKPFSKRGKDQPRLDELDIKCVHVKDSNANISIQLEYPSSKLSTNLPLGPDAYQATAP